ncbi:DUF3987 domain-containing protein [Fluviicola chungangensis]|uniref:DUF3987 domain-containing protein n=1 Tax=Fluviicola chungangensis TaxID=2597671 RepID=A0A556MQV7_9FLAO|nr:DUF3987 domain-containing protein [Fluviicola chungangensis]TSJ42265.1 DUF3987 domain-containing protein [Fluviicola chungangensis]
MKNIENHNNCKMTENVLIEDDNIDISTSRQNTEDDQSLNFKSLPLMLQNVCSSFDDQYKEMMLLSAITVISSVMPNVYGTYDKQRVYPNLFLYVLGKAGSGKGNLVWSRRLLSVIEQSKPEAKTGGLLQRLIEDPKALQIPDKIIIPANNSSAGFIKILNERGGKGLLFETEGDTIANVFKSDYGDYSEMLRKAFHHEPITSYRKTDNVLVDLEEPKISVVISSTPNQLKRVISNAENGLFSRFMYVLTEPIEEFLDVFASGEQDRTQQFQDVAKELSKLYQTLLRSEGIRFSYTLEQGKEFLNFFGKNKSLLTNLFHEDLDGSVNRMGLITFRISMILTVLRNMDSLETDKLVCGDEDFHTSLKLAEKLLLNANKVMEILPYQTEDELSGKKLQIFQLLPDEFTTSEAKEMGSRFGMSDRTTDRFLKTACFEKTAHGAYKKVA